MDDTPKANTDPTDTDVGKAIERLADVDPAEAPELAEGIARRLGDELDPASEGAEADTAETAGS